MLALWLRVGSTKSSSPLSSSLQPVPPASHRDEDLQLQLALRLSQQEHQKVVRGPSRLGLGCRCPGAVLVEVLWGTNRLLCCSNSVPPTLLSP